MSLHKNLILTVFLYSTRASCIQTEDIPMQGTCLPPRPPSNGYIQKSKLVYKINEQVESICKSGYILRGESHRTCTENGSWSDVFQFCSKIISFQSPAFLRINSSIFPDKAAVDGKAGTCARMDNKWWVKLDKPYKIRSIRLKAKFGHFQAGFKIFVSILEHEDSNETRPCCELVGSGMKSIEGEFYCSKRSYLHAGRIVEISSLYKGLQLCESQLFIEDNYTDIQFDENNLQHEIARQRIFPFQGSLFCENAAVITVSSLCLSIILLLIIVGEICHLRSINKKKSPGKKFFNKQAQDVPLQAVLRNNEDLHKSVYISGKNSLTSAVYEEIPYSFRSLKSDSSDVDEHGYLIVTSG